MEAAGQTHQLLGTCMRVSAPAGVMHISCSCQVWSGECQVDSLNCQFRTASSGQVGGRPAKLSCHATAFDRTDGQHFQGSHAVYTTTIKQSEAVYCGLLKSEAKQKCFRSSRDLWVIMPTIPYTVLCADLSHACATVSHDTSGRSALAVPVFKLVPDAAVVHGQQVC